MVASPAMHRPSCPRATSIWSSRTDDEMTEVGLARLNDALELGFEAIKAGDFSPGPAGRRGPSSSASMITVVLVGPAEEQLHEIAAWWMAHREASPWLVLGEFDRCVRLLESTPDAGARFHRSRVPGVRALGDEANEASCVLLVPSHRVCHADVRTGEVRNHRSLEREYL